MEITREIIKERDHFLNVVVRSIYGRYKKVCHYNGISKKDLKTIAITQLYFALRKREEMPEDRLLFTIIKRDLIDYIRQSNGRYVGPGPIHVDDDVMEAARIVRDWEKPKDMDIWVDIAFLKKYSTNKERHRQLIDLLSLGYSKAESARILGVTGAQISYDIKAIIELARKREKISKLAK